MLPSVAIGTGSVGVMDFIIAAISLLVFSAVGAVSLWLESRRS
jgi:hypothetical protein